MYKRQGRQVEVPPDRRATGSRLGIGDPERAEPREDVFGGVAGVEGPHALGVGECAVVDVVEVRVVLHRDPHRFAIRHRHLDHHAAGGVVGVGDQWPFEGGTQLPVDHVDQRRVQHHPTVELDHDVAGAGDVAEGFASGPDRGNFAGAGVFGDDTTAARMTQAGIGALESVVIPAGPVVTGELPRLFRAAQLRQSVKIAVRFPAYWAFRRGR